MSASTQSLDDMYESIGISDIESYMLMCEHCGCNNVVSVGYGEPDELNCKACGKEMA